MKRFLTLVALFVRLVVSVAEEASPEILRPRRESNVNATAADYCVAGFDCTLTTGRITQCNGTIPIIDAGTVQSFQNCLCADGQEAGGVQWKTSLTNCTKCLASAGTPDPSNPNAGLTVMENFCNTTSPNATELLLVGQDLINIQAAASASSAAAAASSASQASSLSAKLPSSSSSTSSPTDITAPSSTTDASQSTSTSTSYTTASPSQSTSTTDNESTTSQSSSTGSAASASSSKPKKGHAQGRPSPRTWTALVVLASLLVASSWSTTS